MSCCPTNRSALPCDYTPKGSIGAHHSYVVSSESPVRGLIVITDIFGLSEQAKYVADQLAERLNARIIMPDCFDGKPWLKSNFPPKEPNTLMPWIHSAGHYDKMRPKIIAAAADLTAAGVDNQGLVGFCWGAKICHQAQVEGLVKTANGSAGPFASPHPSFLAIKDFTAPLVAPVCLLPSQDEDADVYAGIEKAIKADKTYGDDCVFETFDTMHHGWMAARADFGNKENVEKIKEGLDILQKFFEKTL